MAPVMNKPYTFIDKHGLWDEEERRQAEEIKRRIESEKLRGVRLAWGDTHGYSREDAHCAGEGDQGLACTANPWGASTSPRTASGSISSKGSSTK